VPSLIFLQDGDYVSNQRVIVRIPISIIGAGCEKTTLWFSLSVEGKKNDGPVMIADLKIKEKGKGVGLYASNGMNLIVKNCTVETVLLKLNKFSGIIFNGKRINAQNKGQ